eukprot:TRINITY_DN9643_c0_g1_i1.p1 TRINITY_DN9643_c0_g1~~TRINITY_DN9643_c0_g1_i1.p1  ORF type:complete len:464 (-),score=213.02 TRINITY_DN9643_c0_g1_i1:272-1663(-)
MAGSSWLRRATLLTVVAHGLRLGDSEGQAATEGELLSDGLRTLARKVAPDPCSKYEPMDEEGCKQAGCKWTPDKDLGGLCKSAKDPADDPKAAADAAAAEASAAVTDEGKDPLEGAASVDAIDAALAAGGGAKPKALDAAPVDPDAVKDALADPKPTLAAAAAGGPTKPTRLTDSKEIDAISDAARAASEKEGLVAAQTATKAALEEAKEAEKKAAAAKAERQKALEKLQNLNALYKELEAKSKQAKAKAAAAAANEAAIKVKVFKAAEALSRNRMKSAEADEKELRKAAKKAEIDAAAKPKEQHAAKPKPPAPKPRKPESEEAEEVVAAATAAAAKASKKEKEAEDVDVDDAPKIKKGKADDEDPDAGAKDLAKKALEQVDKPSKEDLTDGDVAAVKDAADKVKDAAPKEAPVKALKAALLEHSRGSSPAAPLQSSRISEEALLQRLIENGDADLLMGKAGS